MANYPGGWAKLLLSFTDPRGLDGAEEEEGKHLFLLPSLSQWRPSEGTPGLPQHLPVTGTAQCLAGRLMLVGHDCLTLVPAR